VTPPDRAPERAPIGAGFEVPLWHRVAERAIHATAFVAIASIALIFVFIAKEALPLLWERDASGDSGDLWGLLAPRRWPGYAAEAFVWQPVGEPPKLNIVPLFAGTLKITTLAMLFSVPLGVGAALYVSQYASRRAREVIKPTLELLASIPSVVLGFFALMVFASWLQDAFDLALRLNALVAAVGMSLAIVPIVFTISEDSMRRVPADLAEAATALGARRWQVALRVVVPAALPGIAASVLLGFGRALGETMVVLMASGNAAVMDVFDPTSSARTVTATIAAELGEVAVGDPHWRVLFLLGALLFAVTFTLNRLSASIVRRLHRRLEGDAP